MAVTSEVIPDRSIPVLDHGFVRLDAAMADDLSVVNAARVSFARRRDEVDDADAGLIRFLMRDRHGTPFEHNSFRFHIRCPIFVAREWFRHRIGCLTGDTVVTVVDVNGHGSKQRAKTIDELWQLWSRGERNGHAPAPAAVQRVRQLSAAGKAEREIARLTGVGRNTVRRIRAGEDVAFRNARWRVRQLRVRVLNEETGEFTTGRIADVIDKGLQPVYRLTLADGKQLKVTENHRLLTDQGWLRTRVAVGLEGVGAAARMTRPCRLLVNGVPRHRNPDWLAEQRRAGASVSQMAAAAGCSYDTIRKWLRETGLGFERGEALRGRTPWNKGRRYATGRALTEGHRAAIRAARSGPRSNFWRGGCTDERALIGAWTTTQAPRVHARFDYACQLCGARGGKLHAHHVVPVWLDPSLARVAGNLVTVCESCHRSVHSTVESELVAARALAHLVDCQLELPATRSRRGVRLTAHGVDVVALEYVGVWRTYDLSIAGPWHNFVANGVVVHNSFNEFSMRYAKATDDFYVPEADDVRSQVGKPGSYSFEPVDPELAERTREELQAVYDLAYATYTRLVEEGVARELARSVLPVGAYTEFYWTVNARALMNFVSLRAADTAQREIRRYAEAVERFLAEQMPITHAAFVANDRTAP